VFWLLYGIIQVYSCFVVLVNLTFDSVAYCEIVKALLDVVVAGLPYPHLIQMMITRAT